MQNLEIPIQKWQEVNIDFVTDLPIVNYFNSIMTVINKATRLTLLVLCNKIVTAQQATEYYFNSEARPHGIPKCIYIDKGT